MNAIPTPSILPSGQTQSVRKRRCARHTEREAAACCVSCGLAFCRECVTEHDGRLLCAECFGKENAARASAAASAKKGRAGELARGALTLGAAMLLLWLCFFWLGRLLVRIPPDFNEGTIWKNAVEAPAPR